MSRSSGAIFFMELNSSIHSSQKFEVSTSLKPALVPAAIFFTILQCFLDAALSSGIGPF